MQVRCSCSMNRKEGPIEDPTSNGWLLMERLPAHELTINKISEFIFQVQLTLHAFQIIKPQFRVAIVEFQSR